MMMKTAMKKLIVFSLALLLMPALLILFNLSPRAATTAQNNPYNAVGITVNSTNESGEAKSGTQMWYRFTAPAGNLWVIARLTGTSDAGVMQMDILDAHLNVVKESYTHTGNHIAEIVCRMEDQGVGSKDELIPRLIAESVYYIRISGVGKYNLNLDSFTDDYKGDLESASVITAGTPIQGKLERDDDIDSFYFDVTQGSSYKVTVTASKKMDVRIADKNDYTMDTNSLRVARDHGTSEYTLSGVAGRRYFYLSGLGGTQYKITIDENTDPSQLGLWTKVTATAGSKAITVKTMKGAKVIISVQSGKGKKKIYIRKNKKKKKKVVVTQTSASKKYKLTRALKPGDVVIVTATKKRYKEFNYKKKIK